MKLFSTALLGCLTTTVIANVGFNTNAIVEDSGHARYRRYPPKCKGQNCRGKKGRSGKRFETEGIFAPVKKTPPKYDALVNEGIAPPKNGKAPRPKRGKHSPSYTVTGKGKNNGKSMGKNNGKNNRRPHRLPGKYSRPTGKGSPKCPPKRLSRDLDGARVRRQLGGLGGLLGGLAGGNSAGLPGAQGGALAGAILKDIAEQIDQINALCF